MNPLWEQYQIGSKKRGDLLYGGRQRIFPTQHPSVKAKDKYPIVPPDPSMDKWFKANPTTTGIAMGGGLNGTSPNEPRTVMLNPYSKLDTKQREAVAYNEKLRHFLAESNYDPEFEPTKEQIEFFKGTAYAKPENRKELKHTLVARILTSDESAGKITPEQRAAAERVKNDFENTSSNVVIFGYSESKNGPIYAIPSMVGGKQLSENEAIKIAKENGLHKYPKHPTGAEHNAWAAENHGNIDADGFMKKKDPPRHRRNGDVGDQNETTMIIPKPTIQQAVEGLRDRDGRNANPRHPVMTQPDTVPFDFFDFVWMRIDEDGESPGMGQVIGILFKPGATLYQIQWSCDRQEYHYEAELTREKPVKYVV